MGEFPPPMSFGQTIFKLAHVRVILCRMSVIYLWLGEGWLSLLAQPVGLLPALACVIVWGEVGHCVL